MSVPVYVGSFKATIQPGQKRLMVQDGGVWELKGEAGSPGWRAVTMVVDGKEVYGYRPTAASEPFDQAVGRHGVFAAADLLTWKGPTMTVGQKVELIVVGGDRVEGTPTGDLEDRMDWGSLDKTTQQPTVVSSGILTVA